MSQPHTIAPQSTLYDSAKTPEKLAPALTKSDAPAPPANRTRNTQSTARGSRVRRSVRHAFVLAMRNLIKTARTPEQLIDVTIQPMIFLLLFVYVFGGAIGGGDRHDYLQYLLPGLLAQSIVFGSIALGQNMNADIDNGVFDRFRALPIARSVPLVGAVVADFVRYLLVCVITLGFGYVLGFRVQTNVLAALGAVALAIGFALCFCWVSLWVGLKARNAGSVQGIMFVLLFPLSFGSSIFTPTKTMPGWLQAWNHVNPITKLVDAMRGLLIGGPVGTNVLWTLVWMAGLLLVFVPLAMRAYKRRS
ncbi:ABC transporter permease [uncultured Jatrophihabitans sp.]|uniref:ABC transporter permease n=1 Tax=uncultured Jatrophihabitans sp. TaxID=1610747 RepID=UPI0035CB10B3